MKPKTGKLISQACFRPIFHNSGMAIFISLWMRAEGSQSFQPNCSCSSLTGAAAAPQVRLKDTHTADL